MMELSDSPNTPETRRSNEAQQTLRKSLHRDNSEDAMSVDCCSVASFNLSEYESDGNSRSFGRRPSTLSMANFDDEDDTKLVRHSHWFYRSFIACTDYATEHWSAMLTAVFICLVLSSASIGLCMAYFDGQQAKEGSDALELAGEAGRHFSEQLNWATLPLLSLAQMVTEIESFRNLSRSIGPPNAPTSLPYSSDKMHRNLSGSVCNNPETIARYEQVTETIKINEGLEDVLLLLELAPYGVVCMVQPRIDPERYLGNKHPLNSSALLGLDYLSDPMLWWANYTLNNHGNMTLSGPNKITIPCNKHPDGSRGGGCRYNGYSAPTFEARMPIHVPGYEMEVPSTGGTKKVVYPYWGFAMALIHLEALIDGSELFSDLTEQGFEFQLKRKVVSEKDLEALTVVVMESPNFSWDKSVSHSVNVTLGAHLSGETWTMTVAYGTQTPWQVWVIPLLVMISFCISCFVFKILLEKQDHINMKGEAMAQKSKIETERNMTAYFAHELRNPLSAMDSALKAMPDEDLTGPAKELMSGMRICSSFMSSIMNNLLDVRKMEEGELTLKRMPVNLNRLVESLHRMFLPNVQPGVEFLWRSNITTSDRRWVVGDAHRLQQILTNIITNALKYTSSGSVTLTVGWEGDSLSQSEGSEQTIVSSDAIAQDMTEDPSLGPSPSPGRKDLITAEYYGESKALPSADVEQGEVHAVKSLEGKNGIMKVPKRGYSNRDIKEESSMRPRIRFQCTDTGPGILKSHQNLLFKKFVQRGGAPGTGLGLAIAKHLVELMDGEIYYKSDPTVKPGSTCVVILPLPPCHAPPKSESDSEKHGKSREKLIAPIEEEISFLIVDDIKMNRLMLKRRFQKGVAPHCKITEASHGEAALKILETESFDVIIIDQYMEDAGGLLLGTDTILAMRRRGIESLIIGCSGNDIEKDFLEAGANHCWQKPLPSNGTIIRQLTRHMERTGRARGGHK